jgi:hypothetical protein
VRYERCLGLGSCSLFVREIPKKARVKQFGGEHGEHDYGEESGSTSAHVHTYQALYLHQRQEDHYGEDINIGPAADFLDESVGTGFGLQAGPAVAVKGPE